MSVKWIKGIWQWLKNQVKRKAYLTGKFVSWATQSIKVRGFVIPLIYSSFDFLDIFGDDLQLITDTNRKYVAAFSILVWVFVAFVSFLQLKAEKEDEKRPKEGHQLLDLFIREAGIIVNLKKRRFQRALKRMQKKERNKFHQITNPEDQFDNISEGIRTFLREAFGIGEDQANITIIQTENGVRWKRIYSYQDWNTTSPDKLINENSAAKYATNVNEPEFFPDKFNPENGKSFWLSSRDKGRVAGSAFVYPVTIEAAHGLASKFVVSLVTYDRQLCGASETKSAEVIKGLLKEFFRRFDLELHLLTVKNL